MVSSTDEVHGAIDIGDVDGESARWRSAVLAPGQGWTATILQDQDGSFISSSSVALEAEQQLKIKWKSKDVELPSAPPSSRQAMEFLIEFCGLHGTHAQLYAALAVALNLPAHKCYGIPAVLPSPSMHGRSKFPSVEAVKAAELCEQIPYYMALSCNFHAVVSSLCGMFWEPGIPCNLVSPWLHPVLTELRGAFASDGSPEYMEILCTMCALRRPRLAPLWLGAVFSGLASIIVDFVKNNQTDLL